MIAPRLPQSAIRNPQFKHPVAVSRDDLAERYFGQLPYSPYPVQEEAILAWFTTDQGIMVCAPTGTGKTLIAEGALFEALHTDRVAYYTTPLIALTEQKFAEMQAAAVRWGFRPQDVGLVTGNRKVNPEARILVVVAEILLNRLLHPSAFSMDRVATVVMDEFHSFNDPERGIVWELTIGLLPPAVRLLLLSATVGNALEFSSWLFRSHGRKVQIVSSTERKVPLTYQWVPDELLEEHVVRIAEGDVESRRTPTLVFCFNREECWSVAEQLKGRPLLAGPQRTALLDEIQKLTWTTGAGPKLKQILQRGVGVHHAGMLPKYRRVVEDLYQRKLLAACICTETLAAGINLPARSVVLTSLVKGPQGDKRLLDASTAQQIFGRAGRPQFDTQGYVFALAHEDDVRILRWKQKYDAIPETTKDLGLLKAKKALKKKRPLRRETETYWTEAQFEKLKTAPPGKLYSKGAIPWRLLAYLLTISPEVAHVRALIRKRLMDEPRLNAQERLLDGMLLTLWEGGYVKLEPAPPVRGSSDEPGAGRILQVGSPTTPAEPPPRYTPELAEPTDRLGRLLVFRSIHPLYGSYLLDQLGSADREERLQAFESVLSVPRPLWRPLRVPWPDTLPPGNLARTRLDEELLRRGLMSAPKEAGVDENDEPGFRDEEAERPLVFADKLRLLFDATHPEMDDLHTHPIWAAAELLRRGGNFNDYVRTSDLVKQEGIVFRHLLRLILLCAEFDQFVPPETTSDEWRADLADLVGRLTASCRAVDPTSTDEAMASAQAADVVAGERG